ncbi:MAG: rhomboid family intramembrane serine protease, partial [Planctomycetaceae bacterium]|nr:rhomboid family intramembrane serine protease [Planctomycetaceae bacterium]
MGIYDRDYYRPQPREREYYRVQPQQSWIFAIIIVNVMVFFANEIRGENLINSMLWMTGTTLTNPLEWWRLVTYAFAHGGLWHILFNMLALFIFGPLVERKYGPIEFLCFYFVTAVLGAVTWGILNFNSQHTMLGASGAVSGVIMIVICSYPRMPVYLWGILEMPMWLMGTLFIAYDLMGFLGIGGCPFVAHEVHLAGVAFGALYWWLKWRISSFPFLFSQSFRQERQRRKKNFNPKSHLDRYNHGIDDKDEAARKQ